MPTNNLHSLDSLIHSVRDAECKRLAQEAITTYQAGAYRAAILSIWVAVCADIINKLRELATGGDAEAIIQVKDLDLWIKRKDLKNLQMFENNLLTLACDKFEMLLPHEATDLNRLSDDRNLCAHPAFVSDDALFSPTPELARLHITHSILHLLSRPPVQGKQLITRLDRDLLGGSYPSSTSEIEVVLQQNYLARAKAGSIVSLIKALIKALVGEEATKYQGKENQIAQSLAAIGRINPGLYEEHLPPLVEKLARELGDEKIIVLCRYMAPEPRVWDWMGEAGRARILAKIDNASTPELAIAARARNLEPVGKRFLARLKKENVGTQLKFFSKAPSPLFIDDVFSLYQLSGSFADAEQRGSELLLPHAKYFVAEDVRKLDTSIRKNNNYQILQAGQTSKILSQLFDQTRNLLPASIPYWSSIAEYIVEKRAAENYSYPEFLTMLKDAGVSFNQPQNVST